MIKRDDYLSKLRNLKDQHIIKVITGIRRSGKSTLLESFKDELIDSGVDKKNITFINFEEKENIVLTEWTKLYDEITYNIKSKENQ